LFPPRRPPPQIREDKALTDDLASDQGFIPACCSVLQISLSAANFLYHQVAFRSNFPPSAVPLCRCSFWPICSHFQNVRPSPSASGGSALARMPCLTDCKLPETGALRLAHEMQSKRNADMFTNGVSLRQELHLTFYETSPRSHLPLLHCAWHGSLQSIPVPAVGHAARSGRPKRLLRSAAPRWLW
jgi:hypothetical protein